MDANELAAGQVWTVTCLLDHEGVVIRKGYAPKHFLHLSRYIGTADQQSSEKLDASTMEFSKDGKANVMSKQ